VPSSSGSGRERRIILLALLNLEDEAPVILQNVGNYSSSVTV
jgi:hypothetical protein